MKRFISLFLTFTILFACILIGTPTVYASAKADNSRTIAIVFDNSGSMYMSGNKAWCRATYAMEIFASMLNPGDILQIYPMHPITVGGKEYTMKNPFQITDSAQASSVRDIYTKNASGTPIESIDYAVNGLKSIKTGKKYMIILTDGGTFSKNDYDLGKNNTKNELDQRIQDNAGNSMTVMYLGIGSDACIPSTKESEYFVKKHAVNTADVLSTLTDMCNLIFGRDTLPKNRISGKTIEFDISMSKLIVFVQGDNISDLKIKSKSGGSVGKLISSQQTKYSTKGAGNHTSVADTSLQGMIVTYEDCAAGTYTIDYSGTAASVEVYYEPNADLEFIFTDSEGKNVDSNSLYEGEYKVSFGMKDAKTGKLISSDLLGNPHYEGNYYINGKKTPIIHDGYSGEVPITLKMNDTFEADLTVTYLSGYTISKNSGDFGWPNTGIQVSARPAGELKLEISGGSDVYSLRDLEEGEPYIVKVYYQGKQLTGRELENVELNWEQKNSNATIRKEFANDHYKLSLHYKNPTAPQDMVCGECTVPIYASYSAPGSSEAQVQNSLTYNIKDDFFLLQIDLYSPENYIVIKELESSKAIVVNLKNNGETLTPEEFATVRLKVDCGGIEHTVTARELDSSYLIKLLKTEGIAEGDYQIKVTAFYTDRVGREMQVDDSLMITLSRIPLWALWSFRLLFILILLIIIWMILHIRVLPKHMHTTRRSSSMIFDGDDVTQATNFSAEIRKKSARVQGQFAGKRFGILMDVKPGKESYLYKPQRQRSAEVNERSVRRFGPVKIHEAMIGNVRYVTDEAGKFIPALPNQKPFMLTNGMRVRYSGTIQDAGIDKDFEVISTLNFKKK